MENRNPNILVLGSGIAGLSYVIKLAKLASDHPALKNLTIELVCKSELSEGSTRYAQGGIASVWSQEDSFEQHASDTHIAGAGLCKDSTVNICVSEGPDRVRELIELGVEFTKNDDHPDTVYDLHREGGHGKRRILHAADLTGWEIERALIEQVKKLSQVKIYEHHVAIDLITESKIKKKKVSHERVVGAYILDPLHHQVKTFKADHVILATGGAGKVYLYTSNPDTATGDGIAMAYRAGAKVANLEFIQFHPTCLYHPKAKTYLITEALRGEGAILRNQEGEDFVKKIHPLGSLAPRDVVARAIDREMKKTGEKHVWLDTTPLRAHIAEHFPNIYEVCLSYGIDISKESIPVVPAAHYTCGGIVVDEFGKTTLDGLYALGEVSCTGLHGANRLASNSLLEAVVFAHRAATSTFDSLFNRYTQTQTATSLDTTRTTSDALPEWETGRAVQIEEQIDITANWLEARTIMWNYVGIVRSSQRLERALKRILLLKEEVNTYYWNYLLTKDLIELRNLLLVSELIIRCAMDRKESRGLHSMADYPEADDEGFLRDTVI